MEDTFAPKLHQRQIVLGEIESLFGGHSVPNGRLVILRNAVAIVVHHSKNGLGRRVSLLRGLSVPKHRLPAVLRNALTLGVHPSEEVLGVCVSLLGTLAEPQHSPPVILGNALASGVHYSNNRLGFRDSLLGLAEQQRCP